MEEESTRRMDQFEEEVQGERTSERRRDWTRVRRDWDWDIFCEGREEEERRGEERRGEGGEEEARGWFSKICLT